MQSFLRPCYLHHNESATARSAVAVDLAAALAPWSPPTSVTVMAGCCLPALIHFCPARGNRLTRGFETAETAVSMVWVGFCSKTG